MDHPRTPQDHTIALPDGRALAYAEYGDPAGRPIIFFGGTPSGRLFDPGLVLGVARGIRVIGFDRPGYGRSDFSSDGGLLACAGDVAHLADSLGIARFAVVGYSGGGPYAAACAYRWPARVTAAGLVSSQAPLPGDSPGAPVPPAPGPDAVGAAARLPTWPAFLAEFATQHTGDPAGMIRGLTAAEPESGQRLLAQPAVHAALAHSLTEAFREGLRGWAWDEWVLDHQPWGFAVAALAVPTYVWHGAQDRIVPVAQGRYLAGAIPGCQGHFDPDAGHLLAFAEWPAILAPLVR